MRLLHLHICASDYTVPRLLLNKIVSTYLQEICFNLFTDPKVSMSLILHLFILLFHFMSGSQAWRLGEGQTLCDYGGANWEQHKVPWVLELNATLWFSINGNSCGGNFGKLMESA